MRRTSPSSSSTLTEDDAVCRGEHLPSVRQRDARFLQGHFYQVGSLRAQAGSILACDFLTVETAFLQRIYVLFFISLATRRIEYLACTTRPTGDWVAQQARNLMMELGEGRQFRFLIHDRDTKFSHAFDEVFRSEGLKVIRTPVRAPNANAHAERWVRNI